MKSIKCVREALIIEIEELPIRPYPSGCEYVANCHESFSEARELIDSYTGKAIDQVDIKDMAKRENIVFLRPEIIRYYLSLILKIIVEHPYSNFSDYVIYFVFRPERIAVLELSDLEFEVSKQICLYALKKRGNRGIYSRISRKAFSLSNFAI